jgi:hypothetical protein
MVKSIIKGSKRANGFEEMKCIIKELREEPGIDFDCCQLLGVSRSHYLNLFRKGKQLRPIRIPHAQLDQCTERGQNRILIKWYLRKEIWKRLHE